MDTIRINRLKAEAIIGCNPAERISRQTLYITVSLSIETAKAAKTDDLNQTLNYDLLAQKIKSMTENSSFCLIETLAQKVADIVLQDKRVASTTVTITKPNALKCADSAEIIITRDADK